MYAEQRAGLVRIVSENQNNSLPFSIPGSMVVIRLTPTYSYAWWASTSSDLV